MAQLKFLKLNLSVVLFLEFCRHLYEHPLNCPMLYMNFQSKNIYNAHLLSAKLNLINVGVGSPVFSSLINAFDIICDTLVQIAQFRCEHLLSQDSALNVLSNSYCAVRPDFPPKSKNIALSRCPSKFLAFNCLIALKTCSCLGELRNKELGDKSNS